MVSFANSPQPEPWRRRISRVSGKACTLSSAVFSGRGTASLLKNGRGPGSAFGGRGRPGISKMFANVFNELRSNVRDFSELALIITRSTSPPTLKPARDLHCRKDRTKNPADE